MDALRKEWTSLTRDRSLPSEVWRRSDMAACLLSCGLGVEASAHIAQSALSLLVAPLPTESCVRGNLNNSRRVS